MAGVSSNIEQRRAVLIGCPVGGLKGVEMDLQVMESLLAKYGFASTKAYPATKALIFDTWKKVIDQTDPGDAVVIYYSGHGGLSPKPPADRAGGKGDDSKKPSHLQYLIPVDFAQTTEGDWRGVTTAELSGLLLKTTDKTENVTLILDCCHSARMARQRGTVKTIDPSAYGEVLKHMNKMMREGTLGTQHHERNPHVLAIAAAAEKDYAYEQDFHGRSGLVRRSVLTEALENALGAQIRDNADEVLVSWRSIMLRIRDRMKITCPQQYPQVEGDDLRFAFSLKKADPHGALPVSEDDGEAILGGGYLQGLKEGDTYAVLPFDQESLDPSKQIAEVVVETVAPNVSYGRFEGVSPPTLGLGAKAFLKKRALGKMLVSVRGSQELADRLRRLSASSKLFRIMDEQESNPQDLLATVTFEPSRLTLHSHQGDTSVLLTDWHFEQGRATYEIPACVAQLESLARARHVSTLDGEIGPNAISALVDIELGLVKQRQCEPLSADTLVIDEGERLYLKIHNNSSTTLFVSIFDVSSEHVQLLTSRSPGGKELLQNDDYIYGWDDIRRKVTGRPVSWPNTTPKIGEIPEILVVLIADDKIDNLRDLETTWNFTQRGNASQELGNGSQNLGELINNLASRSSRMVASEAKQPKYLRFGVRRLYFQLRPSSSTSEEPTSQKESLTQIPIRTQNFPLSRLENEGVGQGLMQDDIDIKLGPILAVDLPAPETVKGWENVRGPLENAEAKGFFGAIYRTIAGVPPCVRVVNQHTEEITVIVSKHGPNRILTGAGLDVSATGAGLNFSATTFLSPATKKTLTPQASDPERCEAIFPLWGRTEGFGIITIFTGAEKVPYIENDRVPLGVTVHFSNKPDLAISPYKFLKE